MRRSHSKASTQPAKRCPRTHAKAVGAGAAPARLQPRTAGLHPRGHASPAGCARRVHSRWHKCWRLARQVWATRGHGFAATHAATPRTLPRTRRSRFPGRYTREAWRSKRRGCNARQSRRASRPPCVGTGRVPPPHCGASRRRAARRAAERVAVRARRSRVRSAARRPLLRALPTASKGTQHLQTVRVGCLWAIWLGRAT